jgi:glycogen operon protein
MLRMGDELAHTQRGNNNAYCQDNEISWLDWTTAPYASLVTQLISLRREHPVFRQRAFFQGRVLGADGTKDLAWFTPAGVEMDDADWSSPSARTLGMYLNGEGIRTRGPRGERITDDSFLLLLHAGDAAAQFKLPGAPWAASYRLELDTADPNVDSVGELKAGEELTIEARSLVLLRAYG